MSEPLFTDDDLQKESNHKNVTMLIYILLALGFVTGGLTAIAAVIINYIKRDDVRGSWLEGHFRWQINTFWFGLLWTIIAFLTWLVLLGWFTGALVTIWLVYRIAKGAIYLNDNKTMVV
jgi:uncharacterized membrane protein|tara:strand:+ start:685 stop:1041 length:357 start_codon:yes stop_codon:yes gene_type:complete